MSLPSKYGILVSLYPDHLKHFKSIQYRSKGGCGTDLARDKSGFLEFIEEIGTYPASMAKPTVGRKDHLSILMIRSERYQNQ